MCSFDVITMLVRNESIIVIMPKVLDVLLLSLLQDSSHGEVRLPYWRQGGGREGVWGVEMHISPAMRSSTSCSSCRMLTSGVKVRPSDPTPSPGFSPSAALMTACSCTPETAVKQF